MEIFMKKNGDGLSPILCNAGMGSRYFGCPICGNKVGGYLITGSGEDDWSTHQDKFCSECGQKIDWSNTEWSTIYRF